MTVALEFRDVGIVFSQYPGSRGAQSIARALELLDQGFNRAEISERTGAMIGVAGASLTVERGQISVLMGLSGSGKSTLLRAANRLNVVSRGQVLVRDGEQSIDITTCDGPTLRRIRRQRIAMVFQQFGLLPWRTVRDNVGFGLELRDVPAAERGRMIDEQLELVGLGQWADRYASELSGGMQQRVGLARAFATDADILLMDEPFSALDPLIRTKLQDELLELQEKVKKTILFVSHDLDEALKLGDRITIMEGGRIIQSGEAEDIIVRPANDYIAEFVQHMNPLTALTGATAMRALPSLERCENSVWLDRQQRYRVSVDASLRLMTAEFNGNQLTIIPEARFDGAAPSIPCIAAARLDVPLKRVSQLCQATDHPVLLLRGDSFAGVCTNGDIVRALAGENGRRFGRHALAGDVVNLQP